MIEFKTSVWGVALVLCTGGICQLQAQQFDVPGQTSQITLASHTFGVEGTGDCDYSCGACDSSCCDCYGAGCDACCGGCNGYPAVEFWVDATWFRFHKSGGVNVGSSDQGIPNEENADLGYDLSPRLNLRYYSSCGTYLQISYFEFDHGTVLSGTEAGSSLAVRSWTLDLVAGERFMLNRNWTIDLNGGARWFDYAETAFDIDERANGNTEFNTDLSRGVGGIVGLRAHRCLTGRLSAYAGAKLALLYGDHRQLWNRNGSPPVDALLQDEYFIHTELSVGLEYRRVTAGGTELFAMAGAEFISYENVTGEFVTPGRTVAETVRGSGTDAGYAGFTFSLGFLR